INHVTEGRLDGVVLAAAGVRRLGRLGEVTDFLDSSVMLPAPGQGALAVECRAPDAAHGDFDQEIREALEGLHDPAGCPQSPLCRTKSPTTWSNCPAESSRNRAGLPGNSAIGQQTNFSAPSVLYPA
ncbi:hypothetical protein CJ199_14870, partial [Brevibacterium paucivorans]